MSDNNYDQTTFGGTYIASVFMGLCSAYLIHSYAPKTNSVIKFFVIPMLITYLMILFLNSVIPGLNESAKQFGLYITDRSLTNISSMGYIQIFPPLFAVLVIFIVLLYNRQLDQKSTNTSSKTPSSKNSSNTSSNKANNSNKK